LANRAYAQFPIKSMQRFYIPTPNIRKNEIEITDPRIVFQATRVLRMREGSLCSIFDDNGEEFEVTVLKLNPKAVVVEKGAEIRRATESKLKVVLYQAVPKKQDLFELVLQKATELGVFSIVPLITQRTERQHLGKWERMRTILIEAAEQSNRSRVPELQEPTPFAKAIAEPHCYIAYESGKEPPLSTMAHEIRSSNEARLFIGPEGGFDPTEIQTALQKGAKTFGLGQTILRTETAAIAACSLVLL
jgi:16S rRNA (uracil1498-N3)-methyltransferase